MIKNRLFVFLILLLVCMLCAPGCRKKGKYSKGLSGDDVSRLGGVDITEDTLSARPEGMDIVSSITFDNVLFEYDSAQIIPAERGKIEAVLEYIVKNPGIGVIIEGHCDERGSREYNLALGEKRALAVRAYLIGLGIDRDNIHTKSYGEEAPLHMGHDEESWSINRRAEFVLYNK